MDIDVNALQMLTNEEQDGLTDCTFTCVRTNNNSITIETPYGSYTF
ncbi:hypothetical protein J2Z21_009640 [Streptomyces griseochromogenes]|uniref:Uncharacterized protein n=1 Tax=Streptomyces griseochromogenes TaxID=68214 RepID=A0ABS4MAB6_9ACTN|nr:ALQxL family class IV lanthipeptide [Streptomyces griseochromogenes]MBP2056621.1 hypothetical protein [Streptomyces griseochromogenes]